MDLDAIRVPAKQWMLENNGPDLQARLHRLAFGPRPGDELYELGTDPGQLKNLAGDPEHEAVRKRLSRCLADGCAPPGTRGFPSRIMQAFR